MHKRYAIRQGFTIVELLIVIVVIAILAAISIVAFTGIQNRAHDSSVQSDLRNSYNKLLEFHVVNERYPSNGTEWASVMQVTKSAYYPTPSRDTFINCRTDNRTAFIARSKSGNGFIFGQGGAIELTGPFPSTGAGSFCATVGISSSDPGYAITWIKNASNGWASWLP